MKFVKSTIAIISATACMLSVAACTNGGGAGENGVPGRIEIIVPWAAGGGSDQATRQLAMAAEKTCDTTLVISNRTGAAGATGHEAGAAAKPDGKTLMDMTAEITILPHMGNTTVSYQDFVPIVRFASISPAFVVKADSPIQGLESLVAAMKKGDTVRIGTTGPGGIFDIAAGGFENEVGAKFTERVPYDGGAAIIQAVLGGHVEAGVLAAPEVQAQVESGELRVLAIADDERTKVLPEAPTLTELGYEWATRTWFGIAAPAKTPSDLVEKLETCFTEAAKTEEYKSFLEKQGFNEALMESNEFAEFVKNEHETFGELVPKLYTEK